MGLNYFFSYIVVTVKKKIRRGWGMLAGTVLDKVDRLEFLENF